jgi:hypothetical protein
LRWKASLSSYTDLQALTTHENTGFNVIF